MPILDNPRHEAFAQALAKGMSAAEAYEAAGFRANRGNAVRLKANEHVASRVAELVTKGAKSAEVTIERVARELARIGFADIRKVVTWGPGNVVTVKGSSEIDDDTAAAISEVIQTRDGVKIKFHDKRGALNDLGRWLGMFVDKTEVSGPSGGPLQVEVSARERIAGHIARLAAEVGAGPGADEPDGG